ncbi:hypothetical protein JHK87_056751 [Glycine soja]|nr:hypothetical protein JHK87_056751 [Glycine soja]
MSVASSFPCIKVPACSSSPSCTSSSTSSFRFSSSKPHAAVSIRNSQTEGPLRRPVAPSVREPSSSVPQPLKPSAPSQVPPLKASPVAGDDKNVITLEFQRQKAKELQEYFKQKKLEDANQGPFFGFIGKNEISNGRLADFKKWYFQIRYNHDYLSSVVMMEEKEKQDVLCDFSALCYVSKEWAMFGFAVGLLTEYATGSDFVDQVKILLSNFGIVDLE